jgi:hypothetical protein
MSIKMQLHTKIGCQICNLCLIYGNESQDGRSSCLDKNLEINNNVLCMGIDDNWRYAIFSWGVIREKTKI